MNYLFRIGRINRPEQRAKENFISSELVKT
jgi:hypothetical protein